MTPTEAAKLLELSADATPEQLEARFLELRRKLEDKIAKAPTPGLQAKYRESLAAVTAAFETLALAADGSALPVLSKQSAVSLPSSAFSEGGVPPPREASAKPAAKKSGAGREFLVVTLIALAVLGAGGWWVMKTRGEAAEQKRTEAAAKVAAEQKAAAENAEKERLAEAGRIASEQARQAAEEKRLAEQQEGLRRAAAEKAERERQEQLGARTRASLAETRIAWDSVEQTARAAERRVTELRSDLRNVSPQSPEGRRLQAELNAHQNFSEWLNSQIPRHPARVARAQTEELLSARQFDEAAATLGKATEAQQQLDREIAATRKSLFTLTAPVRIVVPPDATWELTDAYGQKTAGRGPATVTDRALGEVTLEARKGLFSTKRTTHTLRRDQEAVLTLDFVAPKITLNTFPQGASVTVNGELMKMKTPTVVTLASPGTAKVELTLAGYDPVTYEEILAEGDALTWNTALRNDDTGVAGFGYEANAQREFVVTQIAPASPAFKAGLTKDTVIVAVKRDGKFTGTTGLDSFEVLKMLSGDPGQPLVLRVRAPGETTEREVSFMRIRWQELEARMAGLAEVHLLRPNRPDGHENLPLNLRIDGKIHPVGQQEQIVLRTHAGRVEIGLGFSNFPVKFQVAVAPGINYFDCNGKTTRITPLDPAAGSQMAASYKVVSELTLNPDMVEVRLLRPHRTGQRKPLLLQLNGSTYGLDRDEQMVIRMRPGKLALEAGFGDSRAPVVLQLAERINYIDCDETSFPVAFRQLDSAQGEKFSGRYRVAHQIELE